MCFFFFNDTATTEIYTLSLHDALPIWQGRGRRRPPPGRARRAGGDRGRRRPIESPRPPGACPGRGGAAGGARPPARDRKSKRLNSRHANISYAVFCLKKKKRIK